jgi:hypothetical protein
MSAVSLTSVRIECGGLTMRSPRDDDIDPLMAVYDHSFNLDPGQRAVADLATARERILEERIGCATHEAVVTGTWSSSSRPNPVPWSAGPASTRRTRPPGTSSKHARGLSSGSAVGTTPHNAPRPSRARVRRTWSTDRGLPRSSGQPLQRDLRAPGVTEELALPGP